MKFYGKIGFYEGCKEMPNSGGVYKPVIIEKFYTGEILSNRRSFQSSNKQNEDLNVRNQFSILSDFYLKEHLSSIKYIEWQGVKWKVSTVEIGYPRITFETGGVYNDNAIRTA